MEQSDSSVFIVMCNFTFVRFSLFFFRCPGIHGVEKCVRPKSAGFFFAGLQLLLWCRRHAAVIVLGQTKTCIELPMNPANLDHAHLLCHWFRGEKETPTRNQARKIKCSRRIQQPVGHHMISVGQRQFMWTAIPRSCEKKRSWREAANLLACVAHRRFIPVALF